MGCRYGYIASHVGIQEEQGSSSSSPPPDARAILISKSRKYNKMRIKPSGRAHRASWQWLLVEVEKWRGLKCTQIGSSAGATDTVYKWECRRCQCGGVGVRSRAREDTTLKRTRAAGIEPNEHHPQRTSRSQVNPSPQTSATSRELP